MKILAGFAAVAAFSLCAVAFADPPGVTVKDGAFISPDGKALYTYTRDGARNVSNCKGPCATGWPPLMAAPDAKAEGDFTITYRDDGSKQWAYKKKPLYTYSGDKADGVPTVASEVWELAKR